eukprot:5820414-Pyramimonas_sp.AAC.1
MSGGSPSVNPLREGWNHLGCNPFQSPAQPQQITAAPYPAGPCQPLRCRAMPCGSLLSSARSGQALLSAVEHCRPSA